LREVFGVKGGLEERGRAGGLRQSRLEKFDEVDSRKASKFSSTLGMFRAAFLNPKLGQELVV